jgi:hypothetical protein
MNMTNGDHERMSRRDWKGILEGPCMFVCKDVPLPW